jgi:ABC-type nickel/cobalt efflux system permease component RcnA
MRYRLATDGRAVQNLLRIASLFLISLLVLPLTVAAHPMGNFSISHYSGIRIGRDAVELRYIVDMAEIPTFQEIQETGVVPQPADPSVGAFLTRKSDILRGGLTLEVNGRRLALTAASKEIIFPSGAGGLPTMKFAILYKGKLIGNSKGGQFTLNYRDANFAGRAGWKEVIAVAEPGVRIVSSSVPEVDRSSQLSDYPTDLLNSPPQDLEARVAFTSAGVVGPVALTRVAPLGVAKTGTAHPIVQTETRNTHRQRLTQHEKTKTESPTRDLNQAATNATVQLQANRQATPRSPFTELMATKQLGFGIILIALAVAAGLGAFHALEPGHGKTLVAAYLVGARGTMKHALLLGIIVTAAHTAGVYFLGVITLYASQYIVPDRLYPWLGVTSGAMIASLGVILFCRRYLGKDGLLSDHHNDSHAALHYHGHHHTHAGHHHDDHHHSHSHRHHEHGQPTSLRELITLGISGGIVPCPAALVVLLSAVSMDRVGFGLLLIVAFSVGLAAVLVGIGLLMVYARQFMARFHGDGRLTTRWLPMASAAFIFLFGIALTLQSLQTVGLLQLQL